MNPPQFWKPWAISGDVGAIFACVAAGQALSGFATPLYNKIYIAVRIYEKGFTFVRRQLKSIF